MNGKRRNVEKPPKRQKIQTNPRLLQPACVRFFFFLYVLDYTKFLYRADRFRVLLRYYLNNVLCIILGCTPKNKKLHTKNVATIDGAKQADAYGGKKKKPCQVTARYAEKCEKS